MDADGEYAGTVNGKRPLGAGEDCGGGELWGLYQESLHERGESDG